MANDRGVVNGVVCVETRMISRTLTVQCPRDHRSSASNKHKS